MDAGNLVPDELVNDLVAERFRADDRPNHFLMDGYPRTIAQAEVFERLLAGRDLTFRTWAVVDGEFPSGPHDAEGWLITGSRHGAYEDHPWIPPLEQLIRDINSKLGDPPLVTDLRLHFGSGRVVDGDDPVAQLRRWMQQRARPPKKQPTPASAARAAEIEGESAGVDDPELRALIAGVRTRWDR